MFKKYKSISRIIFILFVLNAQQSEAQENIVLKDSLQADSKSIVLNPASDKHDNYVLRANNEFIKGNWEAGKKILEEGLTKYPKYSDFHMLMGKYYLHYKDYDKARFSLNKALDYNSENVEAVQILINVEEQSHRYASAIGYVNDLLEVTPYWKGLWRKKIELYEKQGNKEEAARLRKRILEIYPEDTSLKDDYIYYAGVEAREKAKDGNIDEVIKIHKDIINKEPNNVQNYIDLINNYSKAGDLYNALAYSNRALKQFPKNKDLILRKAGILADQNNYYELLPFLRQNGLMQQYNYYLLQAAQVAKSQETGVLYGKVFSQNPRNDEAFSYVFTDALSKHQYHEALNILDKYRQINGNTKEIDVRELLVYQQMGNTSRADALAIKLFEHYPDDYDIKQAYVEVKIKEAKDNMEAELYESAIANWNDVLKYGEIEAQSLAKNSLYTSYFQMGKYDGAIKILNELIVEQPENIDLYVKMASAYFNQNQYNQALSAYEEAILLADPSEKDRHLSGYADMMTQIIKTLNDQYQYDTSYRIVKRWLNQDPTNSMALHYGFNLAHLTNDHQAKTKYAQMGHTLYPENVYFTIKLAEMESENPEEFEKAFRNLHKELNKYPYHKELIDAHTSLTSKYASSLIKHKESQKAIAKIDTALYYDPNSNILKYTKGLAFEQLHQLDSAYYYQSFYKPDLLEVNSFKQHLNYLDFRSKANQVGIYHLRSRHGDDPSINTVSTIEYTRFQEKNTYTGRVNYAGRSLGKGVQIQGEWSHVWNEKTYTTVNAAWANKFFPHWNINASVFRYINFAEGMQIELGIGYKKFYEDDLQWIIDKPVMYNIVVGATKNINNFRLNAKYNSFVMDGIYMYNLSLDNRYFLASPKNYIMAVAAIGTSPDVDLVNYQLYDGFNIFNTMVGAGFGHMLYKNVSMGVLGTWYNYKTNTDSSQTPDTYNNLYNIYLQLNVAF